MSDTHPNQQLSLKETNGQEKESDKSKIDADRETSSSEYRQQHELHNSRYWNAACRVREYCKIGFPDCKVGSSCCKAGWKNALEEPLLHSRSLATTSESVKLLPSLLISNLSVSRTHSDPCIFGKDFLRITLPLPGEPCDRGSAKGHAIENLECSVVENMDEPMNLVGTGTGEDNSKLDSSISLINIPCKRILPKTIVSSGDDNLSSVQYCFTCTEDDDQSLHNIAQSRTADIEEHRPRTPKTVSLRNDSKFSESFGVNLAEKTVGKFDDTFSDENAAAISLKDGPKKSFRNSRTSRWDDWWTCQSNECSQRNKHLIQRRMQDKSKTKEHHLASAEETEMDQAEEEGLDESYLVFEEHEDQQLENLKEDQGDACVDGDEETMLHPKQNINNDSLDEELYKGGETYTDNSLKEYKEDDIWSDEHFVSSQVKGFPPPISILANETHPGLPGHMPRTLWRSVKRDGRFVLQEVQAQPREFFRATRECGRLRLQLFRPDLDPVRSYTEVDETTKEDSAGTVSVACLSSIENLAGILDTFKLEGSGIVHKGDISGTPTQGISSPQPEDCRTSERSAKSGAGLDKDDANLVGRQPSTSSPIECGTVLEGKTPVPCFGQICEEMFGVGPVGFKEVSNSTNRDEMIRCKTKPSQISEESWSTKMVPNEALSSTTNHFITCEFQSQDLGGEEVGRMSVEGVEVDKTVKVVGLCPTDVAVGNRLDTGITQNVSQIDGEWKTEKMGVVDSYTEGDEGQVEEVEELGIGNRSSVVMPSTLHGHEEQFIKDYQHPCFNSAYGFDKNLKVLSPRPAFMQIPIQPAVR